MIDVGAVAFAMFPGQGIPPDVRAAAVAATVEALAGDPGATNQDVAQEFVAAVALAMLGGSEGGG